MARIPDTLIIRKLQYQQGKSGKEAARISSQYSLQAQEALDCGGLETEMGIRRISKLDRDLRSRRLSPGTTADLLSESIFIALLTRGYPMIP
jgi:triphosphoribosyl-dephospho-CoA synthase